jgi:transposase
LAKPQLIKEKYGIEYSQKQVGVILHSFNMYHSKPYTFDYRRPENAEEILKKVNRSSSRIYCQNEQYKLSQNSNHFYNWIMDNVYFKYR